MFAVSVAKYFKIETTNVMAREALVVFMDLFEDFFELLLRNIF